MDTSGLDQCREKLRETAIAQGKITYGELAGHLDIDARETGPHLKAVYHEEMAAGRPDITLVVVYKKTGFGRYNAPGSGDTGFAVDPGNPAQVKAYNEQLAKVYEYWHRK